MLSKVEKDGKAELARFIREQSKNGVELAEACLAIARGDARDSRGRGPTMKDRLEAIKICTDRGWGLPGRDDAVQGSENVIVQINFQAPLDDAQVDAIPMLASSGVKAALRAGRVQRVDVVEGEFTDA